MGRRRAETSWNWRYIPKLLVESFLYPIRGGNPLRLSKAVIVGGLLIAPFVFFLYGVERGALSSAWRTTENQVIFALIVVFVVLITTIPFAYFLRVVQRTSAEDELPAFGGYGRSVVRGSRVAAIYFLYVFFPLEILGSIIGPLLPGVPMPTSRTHLVFLVFLYLYPAAIANFAEEERLLSALPHRMKSILWSRTYAVGAITSGLIGSGIYVVHLGLGPDDVRLLVPIGLIAFYLFIAQHYVIGRTWRAVEAEKAASEPLETPSEAPIPNDHIETDELRDEGVLSTEDTAAIRGRFETAMRAPDPDTEELLEALRTLHEEGVLTEAEYEENRREITAGTRRTDLETGSTDAGRGEPGTASERGTAATSGDETVEERSVASKARTVRTEGETAVETAPDTSVDTLGFDRETTSTSETGTAGDADGAEGASDRLDRFAILHQLYGLDVLTDREFEAKRRELGPDERGEIPENTEEDLAERLETLWDMYEWGLLTREEYEEKRQDLLEEPE